MSRTEAVSVCVGQPYIRENLIAGRDAGPIGLVSLYNKFVTIVTFYSGWRSGLAGISAGLVGSA